MPAIRRPHTWPDMVSYPLHSVSILFAGENVEANLRPVVDSLGQLKSLVLLMVRRINTINNFSLSGDGVVGVQFDHQILWRDRVCSVYLNLIVSLTAGD